MRSWMERTRKPSGRAAMVLAAAKRDARCRAREVERELIDNAVRTATVGDHLPETGHGVGDIFVNRKRRTVYVNMSHGMQCAWVRFLPQIERLFRGLMR